MVGEPLGGRVHKLETWRTQPRTQPSCVGEPNQECDFNSGMPVWMDDSCIDNQ